MTIKIWREGALRIITGIKVRVAGETRQLRKVSVKQGGELRVVASFYSPLSLSISQDMFGAEFTDGGPAYVQSNTATATPSGGTAPYSYVWSIQSGAAVSFTAPNSATTAVGDTFASGSRAGTALCTVTDANGSVALATCSFVLDNISNL